MKIKSRIWVLVLVVLVALSLTTIFVAAAASNPPTYFTDNIASIGANTNVTVMEQALLDRINAAKTSIDLAIYDFDRVSIQDALVAAHGRGVTVRVVTDNDTYAGDSVHYSALEAAGIPVVNDGRSSIMHNKFFVIDGEVVWSGSTNITDNGFTLNHNNSIVFTSTQVADIYEIEFEEMFTSRLFGTAKSDNTAHTLTYEGIPLEIYFSPSDGALDEVIAEVASAAETVHFAIFSFTDDALRDALIARIQADVAVTGMFDKTQAGNQYSEDETLCLAGAVIKREDFKGLLHNKFMVIDANGSAPVVVTGSMNWSTNGADANDENTFIIHDAATAQVYLAAWQELYNALGPDTLCNPVLVYLPTVMNNFNSDATADVQITTIVYDPVGSDVDGEYVTIENKGNLAQTMTGWTLRDVANNTYTFPSFTLQPGTAVNVWIKVGVNTDVDLFWGRGSSVWNNDGDTAYLRDGGGVDVDVCTYVGGGVTAVCD